MAFEWIGEACMLLLACSLAIVTTEENNYSRVIVSSFDNDFQLPPLRYDPSALEPYISRDVVEAHHFGHHRAYTDNTNKLFRSWQGEEKALVPAASQLLSSKSLLELFWNTSLIPEKFRQTFVNQAGGYVNHILYFECLTPARGDQVSQPVANGRIASDLQRDFGNFSSFQAAFTQRALTLFGSGYVWLVRNLTDERLSIVTTANQDTPFVNRLVPLLTLDVWEHAYYLQSKWKRPEYVANWWRLVNWAVVSELDNMWRTVERNDAFRFLAGDSLEEVPLQYEL